MKTFVEVKSFEEIDNQALLNNQAIDQQIFFYCFNAKNFNNG